MATVLKDFLLPDTPLRGLIIQGDFALCAYLGVPQDHWVADMDSLEFPCHWGVTFNGPGGDGLRPEGWYWYGWDYGHAGDAIAFPPELLAHWAAQGHELPRLASTGKQWTVEEVEHEVIDAAISLLEALKHSEALALNALDSQIHPSDK